MSSKKSSKALSPVSSGPDAPVGPLQLASLIGRIEQTIEAETAGIRADTGFDIKASNARKSRHLYELSKLVKAAGEAAVLSEHRESLLQLRTKLAENEAALLAHLNAVTEVAGLLRDAIQHSEADGTYSVGAFA